MKKSFMKRLVALALVIVSVLAISATAFAAAAYGKCPTDEYINVRSSASSSGARIYKLRNGEPVTPTGTTKNGYTEISAPVAGWVMTSWLDTGAPDWANRYGTQTMNRAEHAQIKAFQNDLNSISGITPIEADGYWGPKTEAAVKELQAKAGIDVDGIAGTYTKLWTYNLSH